MRAKILKKTIAIALAASVSATSASANSDVALGIFGAVLGAAIANQNNTARTQNNRSSGQARSGGGMSSETRAKNREVQEALNYFGFDAGVADGVLGRKSQSAISQFQACINTPITGALNSFEDQFLKSSYFKAQAGGTETLRIVANKPNGYCGLLQDYKIALSAPTPQPAPQPVVNSQTTVVVPQAAPSQQTNVVINAPTTTTTEIYLNDSELRTQYDLMLNQMKLLQQIKSFIEAKAGEATAKKKLASIVERLSEIEAAVGTLEAEAKSRFATPIRPANANLGVTAVKASEVFPRVPYYIPGTDEIGELWIKPHVSDAGQLIYDFNFVAEFSQFERIKDTIELNTDHLRGFAEALVQVSEWSDTAIENGLRRNFEKAAYCFPAEMCDAIKEGNRSSSVYFVIYEDGSTAARIQEYKGRFRSAYNLSIESGLLLSAYMDYMAEIGEKEFAAFTMTDDELDSLFE